MDNSTQSDQFNKLFISENLKRLRKSYNLSPKKVASIIGKSRQGYVNYENGSREIGIHDLITLSGFYNTSIDAIVGNPFSLKNNNSLSFRTYERSEGILKEVMPNTISTLLDDVICVNESENLNLFFWKTNANQKGHVMLFEYYDKPFISKVHYNKNHGGYFYINDEPLFFNKAQAESLLFKGIYMSKLKKNMSIPYFF
jgi:transcriptional regulator with XRE-family HTH domain